MKGLTKVVALISGWVDSLALTHRLLRQRRRGWPLYVRCGLAWEGAEQRAVRRWLAALRTPWLEPLPVVDMPVRGLYDGAHWSLTSRRIPDAHSADAAVYLPGRNLLLGSAAAVYAAGRGVSAVALGTLKGNPFSDATPAFFTLLGRCLSQALAQPMRVLTPLRRLTKAHLIAQEPMLPYRLTLSCLRPRAGRHCGRCNKCAERRRAFARARVADLTRYAS